MTDDLALRPSAPAVTLTTASTAFEPASIDDALRMAEVLCASGLMPKGVNRPEAAFFLIATGRELGLTALQSIRALHIIEGKPSMSADLMAALVKRSAQCEAFRIVKSTAQTATYATVRRGEGETVMSFTIEDAATAGLAGKGTWQKYPAAMLRARCAAALARAVYPDVLLSVYETDELSDAAEAPRYEVTVQPEPARRAPPSPPSEPAPIVVSIERIADMIRNRGSLAEVDALAREVGRTVPAGHPLRAEVGALFAARRAELEPPAAPDPAEPMRQPGED